MQTELKEVVEYAKEAVESWNAWLLDSKWYNRSQFQEKWSSAMDSLESVLWELEAKNKESISKNNP